MIVDGERVENLHLRLDQYLVMMMMMMKHRSSW